MWLLVKGVWACGRMGVWSYCEHYGWRRGYASRGLLYRYLFACVLRGRGEGGALALGRARTRAGSGALGSGELELGLDGGEGVACARWKKRTQRERAGDGRRVWGNAYMMKFVGI
jgi:hypothetical protein